MVGKPLMLDGNKFQWGRREFARVCVRIELDKKLPLGVGWKKSGQQAFRKKGSVISSCENGVSVDGYAPSNVTMPAESQLDRSNDLNLIVEEGELLEGGLDAGAVVHTEGVMEKNLIETVMVLSNPGVNIEASTAVQAGCELKNLTGAELIVSNLEPKTEVALKDEMPNGGKEVVGSSEIAKFKLSKELKSLGPVQILTRGKSMDGLYRGRGPKEIRVFMNNNDLHEVGFVGPKFTWCNNKCGGGRILERLDRCL
ncbi:hypothetical protein M5K25_008346 [Dendrobium thyrsiflorum]|uniref:Uncharacterized protein n=1 Tax=Dendrobium thyrsiflorum TaxID=117978 RepID=A0ABD0V880_DENTH